MHTLRVNITGHGYETISSAEKYYVNFSYQGDSKILEAGEGAGPSFVLLSLLSATIQASSNKEWYQTVDVSVRLLLGGSFMSWRGTFPIC